MGYVYLIEDSNNQTYKIGVTRKNDKRRLCKLQTGNSTKLILKYMFETEYPFNCGLRLSELVGINISDIKP